MNSEETNIVRRVMLKLGKNTAIRMFRNNTGAAWIGKSVKFDKRQSVVVEAGDVLIQQGRFFVAGLCPGSSDLIGFESIVITQEMIGKTIARFTAPEIKTERGRASKEQLNFIDMVNKMGGNAFIATNENQAAEFIKKPV